MKFSKNIISEIATYIDLKDVQKFIQQNPKWEQETEEQKKEIK